MKQYKVEITKEALQDMEDIYNYIAIDLLAPDNAMGQYNRIADEILTLDTFPERFRIMDSEPEKRMELRRMLVDNYSVFYTIRDERVIVTDVLYTASDIIENGTWNTEGTAECANDCKLIIDERIYYYHSECGTFNDKENNQNLPVTAEEKESINVILAQYVTLGLE